jgi:hypothetical protein
MILEKTKVLFYYGKQLVLMVIKALIVKLVGLIRHGRSEACRAEACTKLTF